MNFGLVGYTYATFGYTFVFDQQYTQYVGRHRSISFITSNVPVTEEAPKEVFIVRRSAPPDCTSTRTPTTCN